MVKRDGVEERRCKAEEAVVARRAGREAEKTKEAELIRWCSVTTREPEQKPPPAARPVAMEPMSMSTSEAWLGG